MNDGPAVESLPATPDLLETLDKIPPASLEVLPPDVCIDALVAAANIGNEEIGEVIKLELDQSSDNSVEVPKTFSEMLDTSVGNFAQRAGKAWIKPRNPEGTIRLMKAMQVDEFQKIPIKVYNIISRRSSRKSLSTNYEMPDGSLNSMVSFATNKTAFNEAVHLAGIAIGSNAVISGVASGHLSSDLALSMGAFAINSYCVLAQRYTRARLSLAIDSALKRNKHFNKESYKNAFGIRIPESSEKTDL